MTARDVAARFLAWAIQQGILPAYLSNAARQGRGDPLFDGDSQRAADILRRSGITDIFHDDSAVIVYHPRRLLKRDLDDLPQQIGAVRVGYRKSSGDAVVDNLAAEMAAGVSPATSVQGRFTCGGSIGIGPIPGAGTLGALVADSHGVLFGLTNNHVIGGCNHMPTGLPVVAPGPCDMLPGGIDPFCVGHHAQSVPFQIGIPGIVAHYDNIDAAIFKVANPNTVTSMQRGAYDTPAATAALHTGMAVTKAGRTTGITTGTIVGQAINAVPVSYDLPQVGFSGRAYFDQVYIADGDGGQPFAARGDSGSLVVCERADGSRVSVGLVFAVAGDRTLIIPIDPVLHKLGVSLVGGHHA